MSKIYWGKTNAQTGIGNLWVYTKIRPWWYWKFLAIKLFLSILWRRYELGRLDIKTAWDVSMICEAGLKGPIEVNKGYRK